MSFDPGQNLLTTAFGELSVAEMTPETQINAVYGIRDDVDTILDGTGTAATVVDNNFKVSSGTDADGVAALISDRFGTYRTGQGLLCRFTALFDPGVSGNNQAAGLINTEDGFVFGYFGTSFGLSRYYGGVVEVQSLQITTPAAGAENATITVDGAAYTVPLTAGTVQHNAFEIANDLNTQVPDYRFSSNDDTVTAITRSPRPAGSFAFTSATAVAAWTQIAAGAAPTFDHVPLLDWDFPPEFTIDPAKGNVYAISIQYLGYGGIKFYIENPETAEFELVHVYKYSNAHTTPSVSNPTFKIGWASQNIGATTSVSVKGASAAVFVEGKKKFDERSRGVSNEVISLGAIRRNILSVRNRIEFDDKNNKITMYPQTLILSAAHNKSVIYHIDTGVSFAGDLDFAYLDEPNSCAEFAIDNAAVSADGREIATFRIRSTAPAIIDMRPLLEVLLPGEILTISAVTSSGTGAEADASIAWIEDP
jgi:hypothetical protein